MSEDIGVILKRYADAIDKDRGFESGVTDCLRSGADTIKALRGEVARLDKLNAELDTAASERLLRVFALEAEVARLKGALEAIEQGDYYGCVSEFAAKAIRGETT